MFGLDNWVASFSDGATLALVCLVAVVLGLRHATDPDHLAAVTTLIAGTPRARHRRGRPARALPGASATRRRLFAFGLPIVLFQSYLPEPRRRRRAETTVGARDRRCSAVSLLLRWHRGAFHTHRPSRPGARARRCRRSGSASSTGWAAARASASCCWPRSTTGRSRSRRSGCSRSAPRSRWRRSRPASASRSAAGASAASSPPSRRCWGCVSLSFGVWYALGALQRRPLLFLDGDVIPMPMSRPTPWTR